MVFVIDLPRLEANGARGTTVFAEDVANFLKASGVEDAMVKSLGNYDFSATENLGFVCSMFVTVIARLVLFCFVVLTRDRPGGHTGDALRRVGEWRLPLPAAGMEHMLTAIFSMFRLLWLGGDCKRPRPGYGHTH